MLRPISSSSLLVRRCGNGEERHSRRFLGLLEGLGATLSEHPRHSEILLATVPVGGASAIFLHMPSSSSCLQAADSFILDGTFLTVPAGMPVNQVLTVHSVIQGNNFHPFVALMQNRHALYTRLCFNAFGRRRGTPASPISSLISSLPFRQHWDQ